MKPLIIKAVILAAAVTSLSAAANDASAASERKRSADGTMIQAPNRPWGSDKVKAAKDAEGQVTEKKTPAAPADNEVVKTEDEKTSTSAEPVKTDE